MDPLARGAELPVEGGALRPVADIDESSESVKSLSSPPELPSELEESRRGPKLCIRVVSLVETVFGLVDEVMATLVSTEASGGILRARVC